MSFPSFAITPEPGYDSTFTEYVKISKWALRAVVVVPGTTCSSLFSLLTISFQIQTHLLSLCTNSNAKSQCWDIHTKPPQQWNTTLYSCLRSCPPLVLSSADSSAQPTSHLSPSHWDPEESRFFFSRRHISVPGSVILPTAGSLANQLPIISVAGPSVSILYPCLMASLKGKTQPVADLTTCITLSHPPSCLFFLPFLSDNLPLACRLW